MPLKKGKSKDQKTLIKLSKHILPALECYKQAAIMLTNKGYRLNCHPMSCDLYRLKEYILIELHGLGVDYSDHDLIVQEQQSTQVVRDLAVKGCLYSRVYIEIMDLSLPYYSPYSEKGNQDTYDTYEYCRGFGDIPERKAI